MLQSEMAIEYIYPINILPGRSIEQYNAVSVKCSLYTLTSPSASFFATTMD